MSSSQNQVYSQGFNFDSFIQKGVDARTGQYTCTIDIYEVNPEVRNCAAFKLSLSFNPLNTQDVGLGIGWSFVLPSYENRTVFLSTGESYKVTEFSSSVHLDDEKLKSANFDKLGPGLYQLTYKSGQVEILTSEKDYYNKAVIDKLYSHNGRSLSFTWTTVRDQPRLEKILQDSEVLVEVKYKTFGVEIVRAPGTSDAATFSLDLKNDELQEIQLPDATTPSWKFDYDTYGGMKLLTEVVSPSGQVEDISYREEGHRLPEGAPFEYLPYVLSHVDRPGVGQPAIKTNYQFSDRNFLAYNGGHHWNDGQDNLFRVPYDYEYSSTVDVEGGTTTDNVYNKFHLLTKSQQQKKTKIVTQMIEYHALPRSGFDEQPPQYQLPKKVQTNYRDTTSSSQTRTETTLHAFDEWGNPTEDTHSNGTRTVRTYYPPTGEAGNCPADPHGFQRYIKTETVVPASSTPAAPTRVESFTYADVPTASGAKASRFVAVKDQKTLVNNRIVTSTAYDYVKQPSSRDHGRVQLQVCKVADKFPTTKTWAYSYPQNREFTQAVTTKTHDNISVTESVTRTLALGIVSSRIDEAGVREQRVYDILGRLTKAVMAAGTPYEAVTQYGYSIPAGDNGHVQTVTDANGVQSRTTTDGLGRTYKVEKQDDGKVFRVVEMHAYNAQGQRSTRTDSDWLRLDSGSSSPVEQKSTKTFAYDDWGKVCKTTDSSGLIALSSTDPITLIKTEGIQGEGSTVTQLNLFGLPAEILLRKRDGSVYSKITFSYDGLGRLVRQTDQLGRVTSYTHDDYDRVIETSSAGNRSIETQYAGHTTAALPNHMQVNGRKLGDQTFDGLGRLTMRTIGARATGQSYDGTSPEPRAIQTARGDQIQLGYVAALRYAPAALSGVDHSDGFEYDARGALSQSKGLDSTHDLSYLSSGQLSQETFSMGGARFQARHVYSLGGKLQEYTDVHGVTHRTSYDAHGRKSVIQAGGGRVSFAYDSASRVAQVTVEDDKSSSKLISTLSYDDFGREAKRSVKRGTTALYELILVYNALGLIASRVQQNGSDKMRDESFLYDEHNRLRGYSVSGSKPPLDEKGHPVREQTFEFDANDNVSQVTSTFQDGTTNTARYTFTGTGGDPAQLSSLTNTHKDFPGQVHLEYDSNGCLTRDEQGRRLEYNSLSRLTAVRDAQDTLVASYKYDGGGRLIRQLVPGQQDTHLFYRGETLVAVQKGDKKTSFLSNGSQHWGQTITSAAGSNTHLWAIDGQNSVLASLSDDQIQHHQYTPYGYSPSTAAESCPISYTGQWKDPITGWYHLGNGYRVYNPVLMRFHSPDPWSPFTSGEINPYAYCLGDPINRTDPSGHFSLFGMKFGWRDLIMTAIGITVSIGVGILTGGASLAVQVGVSLAVGLAVDVAGGMAANAIEGKGITWESVGLDALGSLAGGLAGSVGGTAFKSGFKALKGLPAALGRAGSYTVTQSAARTGASAIAKSTLRGAARELIPAMLTGKGVDAAVNAIKAANVYEDATQSVSSSATEAAAGEESPSKPLGRLGPNQVGAPDFFTTRASFRARDVVRPAMKDGAGLDQGDNEGLSAFGGAGVAELLNRNGRFVFIALKGE